MTEVKIVKLNGMRVALMSNIEIICMSIVIVVYKGGTL